MNWAFQYVKDTYNASTQDNVSVTLTTNLMTFVNHQEKNNQKEIKALIAILKNRILHITSPDYNTRNQKEDIETEKNICENILNQAETLLKMLETPVTLFEQLEELQTIIKNEKLKLTREGKTLFFRTKIKNEEFQITNQDYNYFDIVKGLAICLTTRYLQREDDNHGYNFSLCGQFIDFDHCKKNILHNFHNPSWLEGLFRTTSENKFVIDAQDIRNFPILNVAKPYYWPTNDLGTLNTSSNGKISARNAFTQRDIEQFKKLATNPIFIFYKFKTMLKYLLTDMNIFTNIYKLYIQESDTFKDKTDNKEKNLLNVFIQDEKKRIEELRAVLIAMPEFQEFITNYGSLALKLIEKEVLEYKNKFVKKAEKHAFYQPLAEAIDLQKIDENYQTLLLQIEKRKMEMEYEAKIKAMIEKKNRAKQFHYNTANYAYLESASIFNIFTGACSPTFSRSRTYGNSAIGSNSVK